MKQKLTQFLMLATFAPVFAACSVSGKTDVTEPVASVDTDVKPPVTSLYTASYAAIPGQTFGQFMDVPGKKIEGAASASRFVFGDKTSNTVNDAPKKMILEQLSDPKAQNTEASALFKLTYGNASVTFNRADFITDSSGTYLEKFYLTDNQRRHVTAYFYSLDSKELALNGKIVVPLGFGFRLKADGTTATKTGEGIEFVNAYTVVGLETNPNSMPKDRTATYKGGAELRLDNKLKTHEAVGMDRAYLYGDTTMVANFASGKITGSVKINKGERVDETSNGTVRQVQGITDDSAFGLSGDIASNGFTLGLEANDNLKKGLASEGITDLTATGDGRFYGTEAEGMGALITGSSKDYLLNGVIWGEVAKP